MVDARAAIAAARHVSSAHGVDFNKGFEALVGGTLTVGYGHTGGKYV